MPAVRRDAVFAAAAAAAAVSAAAVPVSPYWVERWYSLGLYPRLQRILTPAADTIPLSLLDAGLFGLLVAGFVFVRRRSRRSGWRRAVASSAWVFVATASVLYLVFLLTWGLNYRRVPLEQKLSYDPSRVTRESALRLGALAVQRLNEEYAAAHAAAPGPTLQEAFAETMRALGHVPGVETGRPKWSLLTFYFRQAGVDGMTNPFFLDIIVNPEVLPIERPDVLAHEWAHLAGYADEAEANFIAWLTCLRGDAQARYSGWLSLYGHVAAGLALDDRRSLSAALADGPRADLRAIAARHARGSRLVQRAQRGVYDAYLRAHRVDEGVARYNAVARLVLGTSFESGWIPRKRRS